MPREQAAAVKKVAPVRSTRQFQETADETVGQDQARAMRSRGPARTSLAPTVVQPVERVVSKDKLEALAFMEEEITVLVHESTNPVDEQLVEVWNDGTPQRFQRGVEQRVKRKYVEVLARAKKTVHRNEKYKDSNGDDAYRYPSSTALKYPFSVVEDANPRGKAWLRSVLNEA